ncbi:MAG: hypothetical protein ACI837_000217 [Crocinitomicaceae bacterium]|jgi:hypothetical protein
MILFVLFLTLICLISYPIFGYKIVMALINNEKKEVRRLLIMLSVFILLPGFYWRALPGSNLLWAPIDRIYDIKHNVKLTGFGFDDGDLLYEYQSERSFHGDGYSIWIQQLDQRSISYFQKPDSTFFKNYPSDELRKGWQIEQWKKTPLDSSENQFFDFAHTSLPSLDFELEDLLNEQGNYYAYYFHLHKFNESNIILNIDFHIICPKRKLLVHINHNT